MSGNLNNYFQKIEELCNKGDILGLSQSETCHLCFLLGEICQLAKVNSSTLFWEKIKTKVINQEWEEIVNELEKEIKDYQIKSSYDYYY